MCVKDSIFILSFQMYNHAHNVIECPWEAFGLHAKALWRVFDFKYYSLCEKYLRISFIRMINQQPS